MQAQLIDGDWEELPGEYDIAPVRPAVTWDGKKFFIDWPNQDEANIVEGRNLAVYNHHDDYFPAEPVEIVSAKERAVPTTAPTSTPSPTATPFPLPSQARIEGFEIVAQGFNNCGPANLTINLNFYGDATTQNEAAAFLKPNREDRNVSSWQLSDYVNEHTALRSTVHSGGDLELVKKFIAAGIPIVIEKGYEPKPNDRRSTN